MHSIKVVILSEIAAKHCKSVVSNYLIAVDLPLLLTVP